MVKQRRAWHAIIAFEQHRQSNDIRCGMPSSPLDGKHGRTTLGVACHHCLLAAQTVERRRAWHAIIALGLHTRSDDMGCGMTSLPLDNIYGRKRRALHGDITALGQNTWSETSSVA